MYFIEISLGMFYEHYQQVDVHATNVFYPLQVLEVVGNLSGVF